MKEGGLSTAWVNELSGVRHHELLIARERAILQDLELEISHQLGDAVRNLVNNYNLTQTNFNRRVAAEKEVEAVLADGSVFDSLVPLKKDNRGFDLKQLARTGPIF